MKLAGSVGANNGRCRGPAIRRVTMQRAKLHPPFILFTSYTHSLQAHYFLQPTLLIFNKLIFFFLFNNSAVLFKKTTTIKSYNFSSTDCEVYLLLVYRGSRIVCGFLKYFEIFISSTIQSWCQSLFPDTPDFDNILINLRLSCFIYCCSK